MLKDQNQTIQDMRELFKDISHLSTVVGNVERHAWQMLCRFLADHELNVNQFNEISKSLRSGELLAQPDSEELIGFSLISTALPIVSNLSHESIQRFKTNVTRDSN